MDGREIFHAIANGTNLAVNPDDMHDVRIGCSGYHFAEWRGIFYPLDLGQRRWFEFYSEHFDTLEFNATFYKFPRPEYLRSWYERSPAHFVFSVKAPRMITHYKRLKDSQQMLNSFYSTISEGLDEKLGCVLFQFPPAFSYEDAHLERIVTVLDQSYRNVVEFRHASWWSQQVFDALAENNITFCSMSHPHLPDQVIKTTDVIYYRFHGVPNLYVSKYDKSKLEQVFAEIQNYGEANTAYVYFNNTADGAAIENARQFQEIRARIGQV